MNYPSSFGITLANRVTSEMVSTETKRMALIQAFRICMTWYRQRWPRDAVEGKIYLSGLHIKSRFPSSLGITLANLLTANMVRPGTKRTALIQAFRICMTRHRPKWPPDAMEEKIYPSGEHFKPKFPFYRGYCHTFLRLFEVAKKCDNTAVVRSSQNLNIDD